MTNVVVKLFLSSLAILAPALVHGQNFFTKPMRIVTSEAGSGNDVTARLIALGFSATPGQQAIVDNRAVYVAIDIAAKAPPDGYTQLLAGSALWLSPLLRDDVTYDVIRDFSPISLLTTTPSLIAVHPTLAANTVKELIALAKARPGELNYSTGSIGGSAHLSAELFKSMAGVDIVRVNYKGAGPALNALIAGQVQMMFPATGSVTPHIKSGRLRALAVTSLQPSALAPGLPTIAESGLPGYESVSILGMFAPAKTPALVIDRLQREITRILNQSDAKEKLFSSGLAAVGSTPGELAAKIKSEMARTSKMVKDMRIKSD